MKRILICAIYPAPYRFETVEKISSEYDTDVFFESGSGDSRNEKWFSKGSFFLLDTEDGKKRFDECKKNISNYDLVILYDFSSKDAVKLILRCIRKKIPFILNCDGVMLFGHGNFVREILKKYLIKHAVTFFASGEHAKRYFLKYGAKEDRIYFHNFTALHKKDILSEPVTYEEKINIRNRLNLPVDKKICIAVGRFITLKRYDFLLKAWKEMPEDNVLLLIGGGPEKENYEKTILETNLKNVILDDFHPFEELLEYYKASDVFVHPTSYDVWGLIINEAMACGLPVVVTDTCVAGLELVKNGENGYVIRLGDDKDLIEKVKKILNDDDLRKTMSCNAIHAIQPYYIENMIDSQMKTINKVLKENA